MIFTLEPDYDKECSCPVVHDRFIRTDIISDNRIISDVSPWHYTCKGMLSHPDLMQRSKIKERSIGPGIFFDGSPDSFEAIRDWMMKIAMTGHFNIDMPGNKIVCNRPMWIVLTESGFRSE